MGPKNPFDNALEKALARSVPLRKGARLACRSRSRSSASSGSRPPLPTRKPGAVGQDESAGDRTDEGSGKDVQNAEESNGRQKAFAWMDSGDEASAGEEPKSAPDAKARKSKTSRSRSRSRSRRRGRRGKSEDRKRRKDEEEEEVDRRPLSVRVAEVQTFAHMIRLSDDLRRQASRLSPSDLAATVAAASRVKFYDAEVFQSGLLPAIRRHLARGGKSPFTTEEAVEVASSMADLNVYDEPIFSKAVELFADRKLELEDPSRRTRLLAAFKKTNHKGDKDFVSYLSQREKASRYEQQLKEMNAGGGMTIHYGGLRK